MYNIFSDGKYFSVSSPGGWSVLPSADTATSFNYAQSIIWGIIFGALTTTYECRGLLEFSNFNIYIGVCTNLVRTIAYRNIYRNFAPSTRWKQCKVVINIAKCDGANQVSTHSLGQMDGWLAICNTDFVNSYGNKLDSKNDCFWFWAVHKWRHQF